MSRYTSEGLNVKLRKILKDLGIPRLIFRRGNKLAASMNGIPRLTRGYATRVLRSKSGMKKGALLAGSSLLLTYMCWDTKFVSCESIKGIKQYNSGPSDSDQSNTISLLSDKEVTQRLRQMEKSYYVQRGRGVLRYDLAQLPSNAPIEDNHIEQVITVPVSSGGQEEADLYFFGVFDGHGGPYTSAKLSQSLVPYVAHQLGQIYGDFSLSEGGPGAFSAATDSAITTAFKNLDRDLVYGALGKLFEEPTKQNLVSALPAISGSCALLTMFDSNENTIKCAVTGDSRALLGSQDSNGQWTVKALSVDQTADNTEEVERIRAEHPGEPGAVRNGRVLGSLQPSRAFGDYRYKIKELAGKVVSDLPGHLRVYFRREPRDFKTPPYVTAEPVITSTKLDSNAKFMVLASDGLFELLTNEEIAGLVVNWMQHSKNAHFGNSAGIQKDSHGAKSIPPVTDLSTHKEQQRRVFSRTGQSSSPVSILDDANVATHLIRNALSAGGNKDYVSTLVSIPSPMSRKYRDDLTVTVVFFGEGQDLGKIDGQLIPNYEATSPPRPKL
ncbi:type 2C protein phosphatase PTC5 [Lachancea thermotolerans CBS 6340]|uniref:KLTH0G08184p n=1 Tax=Lachancea thermotolerans (strain ATCC 56472 / CBS 6340 / NRRL Y-8284) TaxID=559295 RepID=C5DME5_LACTC|nr:KLTH0G08184p [Lachancea thermotolerans CBS 6340]CAR24956.1 KLTH0G08184p [Lachancea thermotolerans CBS 6340]